MNTHVADLGQLADFVAGRGGGIPSIVLTNVLGHLTDPRDRATFAQVDTRWWSYAVADSICRAATPVEPSIHRGVHHFARVGTAAEFMVIVDLPGAGFFALALEDNHGCAWYEAPLAEANDAPPNCAAASRFEALDQPFAPHDGHCRSPPPHGRHNTCVDAFLLRLSDGKTCRVGKLPLTGTVTEDEPGHALQDLHFTGGVHHLCHMEVIFSVVFTEPNACRSAEDVIVALQHRTAQCTALSAHFTFTTADVGWPSVLLRHCDLRETLAMVFAQCSRGSR